jgi:hypothetical protein
MQVYKLTGTLEQFLPKSINWKTGLKIVESANHFLRVDSANYPVRGYFSD